MFKNFTWGHGIFIALGSFMIFILFMVLIFPNGKQNSDLVSDNYYDDELMYQKVIDSKKNAEKLTEKPIINQTSEGLKIDFPASEIPDQLKVNFELYRTDDSNLDVKKEGYLKENSLLIPGNVISKGSYTLKLKWLKNKIPYQIDYDVLWK